MNERELDVALLGAIKGILNDSKMYYRSSIGSSGEYNRLEQSGKEAVVTVITMFAPKLLNAQQEALDQRAKDLVLKELKT